MGFNNSTTASYQNGIVTEEGLREFIAGGRNKTSRKLANNTVARLTEDGYVAIRLHQTDIITFCGNGTITLNSGGWRSVTTKERMNRYTKAGISQKAGVWYMSDGSLYYDGVPILSDGTVTAPKQTEKYEAALKAIKKEVKEYAKKYVEALKAGKVAYPSAGDCWACLGMVGKGDVQHLKDHMTEEYFVPTLLVNAGRDAGYQDHQIGLMGIGGQRLFIDPERNIYRYMVKQLQRSI